LCFLKVEIDTISKDFYCLTHVTPDKI
jgi:hypothetical protein